MNGYIGKVINFPKIFQFYDACFKLQKPLFNQNSTTTQTVNMFMIKIILHIFV